MSTPAPLVAVDVLGGPLCGTNPYGEHPYRVPADQAAVPYETTPHGAHTPIRWGTYIRRPDDPTSPVRPARPVYEWHPAPGGTRRPSTCSCGTRGCPTRSRPP